MQGNRQYMKLLSFGNGCKASFGRKIIEKPQRWVDSKDPREFKRLICDLKHLDA
jgi:hypothetical protein